MKTNRKLSAAVPASPGNKPPRKSMGAAVKEVTPLFFGSQRKAVGNPATRRATKQDEILSLMLADMDKRLDEIERRTDRLIARQG